MNIYPPDSILMAPLSGFTDLPYRRSLRRHGGHFLFTEMVDAASLAYNNKNSRNLIDRGPEERWLGVQLVGSNPERISKAVEILNERQYEVLDFNLGCPVPKVAKKNAGAALAANPDEAARLLELIAKKSRHPVSAKIRILDEKDPEPSLYLVKKLVEAGARAITVHGRIRKAFYAGPVFFDIIRILRESVDIQIIANGGVMSLGDYDEIRKETGCDCVMLARGAMGNPWLFDEIRKRGSFIPPNPLELAEELRLHIVDMVQYYGEYLGMRIARKTILDYLKGRGYPRTLKAEVATMCQLSQLNEYCDRIAEGPSYRYWSGINGGAVSEERRLSPLTPPEA